MWVNQSKGTNAAAELRTSPAAQTEERQTEPRGSRSPSTNSPNGTLSGWILLLGFEEPPGNHSAAVSARSPMTSQYHSAAASAFEIAPTGAGSLADVESNRLRESVA